MLVLTRKAEESIVIDDRIEITVLEIKNGRVKLGVEAPRSIPVRRSEVERLDYSEKCDDI